MLGVLDIILIALILACIVFSSVKGLITTLLEIAGSVGAVLIAKVTSGYLANMAYESSIKPKVIDLLNENLTSDGGISSFTGAISNAIDSLPKFIGSFLSDKKIDSIESFKSFSGEISVENIESKILRQPILKVLDFVFLVSLTAFLFVIFKIIIRLLSKTIRKTKILNSTDHILGLCFGILKGIIYVLFVIFVLNCLSDSFEGVESLVGKSQICKILKNINV